MASANRQVIYLFSLFVSLLSPTGNASKERPYLLRSVSASLSLRDGRIQFQGIVFSILLSDRISNLERQTDWLKTDVVLSLK